MSSELEHFISRYRRAGRPGGAQAPDLQASLGELSRIHAGLGAQGRLPSPCRCLIEGYAAPNNARCLREYLAAIGVGDVDILAVDLYDLPSVYARMGCGVPPMRFQVADARDLRGIVADHSVDLVVQDFLINCMPSGDVPAVLREVTRVLAPGGLAFVSFTDDQCMADVLAIDPEACGRPMDIRDRVLTPGGGVGWDLFQGRRFRDPGTGAWVFVTRPHGRLEFFSSLPQTLDALASAGLEVLGRSVSQGDDDHGLRCVRHRCILRHGVREGVPT